jgi:hypothetical protein
MHLRTLATALALALGLGLGQAAPVVWRASKLVTLRIPTRPGIPLDAYFARPSTPQQILTLNPGIESAEKVEDVDARTSIWLGRTAPMKFGSGVSVTSVMRFRITHDANEMKLDVLETSTESQGPQIFTRMIDSMLPKVRSSTSMRQSGDSVTSDAFLEVHLLTTTTILVSRTAGALLQGHCSLRSLLLLLLL